MTKLQKEQFNRMALALRQIHKAYMTPEQIRKDSRQGRNTTGLDYAEYLEMSYENIQALAARVVKGVKLVDYN